MSIDFNSQKYKDYLEDQVTDNMSTAAVDEKYLDLLLTLLPNFNYHTAKIYDVGPGMFKSWDWFLEKFHRPITGFDVGREVLENAQKNGKNGLLELDVHRLFDGPYYWKREPYADLVISFHALEHMLDMDLVLKNLFDFIVPGGYLYFAIPQPATPRSRGHFQVWYSVEEVLPRFEKAGFKTIHWQQENDNRFRPEPELIALMQKV